MSSRYPTAQYVVAEGESPLGYEQAAANARAEVAAQLRSSLTAVVQSTMRSETQDGVTHDSQLLESTSQLRTTFDHAERIHSDAASRRRANGLYHVTAYLSRADAASEHVSAYTVAATEFRSTAQALRSPQATDRDWAAAFRHAEAAFATLGNDAAAIRAIMHDEPAEHANDRAVMAALERERRARLAAARVRLVIAPDASPRLMVAMQQALATLGVLRTVTDDVAYELYLTPSREARMGPLGPVCRLTLRGSWRDARSGQELGVLQLDAPEFTGADVRDAQRAEARAWEHVTAEALKPLLQKQLATLLPLDQR